MSKPEKLKKPSVVRTYDKDGFRKRAACICVNDDETKVLLVTSRKDDSQWIVPGGGLEPDEAAATAAVREVREEAGVSGELGRCLGVFENTQCGHRTSVFVLVVTEELDEWDESRTYGRQRQWFSLESAVGVLHKPLHSNYVKLLLPPDHHYHSQPPHPHISPILPHPQPDTDDEPPPPQSDTLVSSSQCGVASSSSQCDAKSSPCDPSCPTAVAQLPQVSEDSAIDSSLSVGNGDMSAADDNNTLATDSTENIIVKDVENDICDLPVENEDGAIDGGNETASSTKRSELSDEGIAEEGLSRVLVAEGRCTPVSADQGGEGPLGQRCKGNGASSPHECKEPCSLVAGGGGTAFTAASISMG